MEKLIETTEYIKLKIGNLNPKTAIILGSGLGALPDDYDGIKIPYYEIPNFQKSHIEGHKGLLCFCNIEGKDVVLMQGRFHFYEGYTMEQTTFPVKIFKMLGIENVILTNAAGSVSKEINVGDLMLITDHINMMGTNPLIGKNYEELGTRFPDMSDIYKQNLLDKAKIAAKSLNIDVKQGVYIAMTGPSYETPAEVRMLKLLGGGAVGMSTAHEAIVANYCGMNVLGISCITNYAAGVCDRKLSHQEVIENSDKVKEKFKSLIKEIIRII